MARQKRFKTPPFLGDLKESLIKKATSALVILVFISVAILLVRAFLYRSDYFRVRSVETGGYITDPKTAISVNVRLLNLHKGKNIFSVNLKNAAASLENSYPDARDVVVKISLPDKLAVNMNFRVPVAIVRNGRDCPIDEDRCILINTNPAQMSTLC